MGLLKGVGAGLHPPCPQGWAGGPFQPQFALWPLKGANTHRRAHPHPTPMRPQRAAGVPGFVRELRPKHKAFIHNTIVLHHQRLCFHPCIPSDPTSWAHLCPGVEDAAERWGCCCFALLQDPHIPTPTALPNPKPCLLPPCTLLPGDAKRAHCSLSTCSLGGPPRRTVCWKTAPAQRAQPHSTGPHSPAAPRRQSGAAPRTQSFLQTGVKRTHSRRAPA